VSNAVAESAGPVREKFGASGRGFGYAVVALSLLVAGVAALTTYDGSRAPYLLPLAFAAVAWVGLVRPDVTAHENGLVLRNMLHDTFVPWSRIDHTEVAQTLRVTVGDEVLHGVGLGRSGRSLRKEKRKYSRMQGMVQWAANDPDALHREKETRALEAKLPTVHSYVEERIRDFRRSAAPPVDEAAAGDAAGPGDSRADVLTVWAVWPVAALVVAAVLVVAVFV